MWINGCSRRLDAARLREEKPRLHPAPHCEPHTAWLHTHEVKEQARRWEGQVVLGRSWRPVSLRCWGMAGGAEQWVGAGRAAEGVGKQGQGEAGSCCLPECPVGMCGLSVNACQGGRERTLRPVFLRAKVEARRAPFSAPGNDSLAPVALFNVGSHTLYSLRARLSSSSGPAPE